MNSRPKSTIMGVCIATLVMLVPAHSYRLSVSTDSNNIELVSAELTNDGTASRLEFERRDGILSINVDESFPYDFFVGKSNLIVEIDISGEREEIYLPVHVYYCDGRAGCPDIEVQVPNLSESNVSRTIDRTCTNPARRLKARTEKYLFCRAVYYRHKRHRGWLNTHRGLWGWFQGAYQLNTSHKRRGVSLLALDEELVGEIDQLESYAEDFEDSLSVSIDRMLQNIENVKFTVAERGEYVKYLFDNGFYELSRKELRYLIKELRRLGVWEKLEERHPESHRFVQTLRDDMFGVRNVGTDGEFSGTSGYWKSEIQFYEGDVVVGSISIDRNNPRAEGVVPAAYRYDVRSITVWDNRELTARLSNVRLRGRVLLSVVCRNEEGIPDENKCSITMSQGQGTN